MVCPFASVLTTKVETANNFGGPLGVVSPYSKGQNVRVLVLGGSPEENKGLEGTWTRAHETLGQFPAPQWGQSIAIGPYEDLDVC